MMNKAVLVLLLVILGGCVSATTTPSGCVSCHAGLEQASPAHDSCVSCHGGDDRAPGKEAAHRSMNGANPSSFRSWEKGCGGCHPYQLQRLASNLMYTATGMIRNIQLTWDGYDGKLYSARGGEVFDQDGVRRTLAPVAKLDNLSGELYRKFCSRCHVSNENSDPSTSAHASGCAACHFPYDDSASYRGGDPSLLGKGPHSASHALEPLPGTAVCTRCHNRSGRIAYSYQGLYDGNNAQVPTRGGRPGPVLASGGRSLTHIAPDVHAAAGMDCIDCHTSRDVMGDGYAYRNMYLQTEIRCEDCHGAPSAPPRHRRASRENAEPSRESRHYRGEIPAGAELVLTGKGRPYSNVFFRDGRVQLLGKRSGRIFVAKVITGTPEHRIAGHRRLECYSCHSRTVVQCYGCHTVYDKRESAVDFITGRTTPGAFSETEDYRTLYPFPLALNQRGKISPVTPGCQTFLSVVEKDGSKSRDEYVTRYKGRQQFRFAPFYSHNTGTRAVGCAECHGNPAFLGFGQHVVAGGRIEGTLICEKSDTKPLDGFLTMEDGRVRAYAAITREHSRPLNGAEVKRVLAVNLCLVCHGKAADPIYRKELDYHALEDALHRRLLTDR